MYKIFRYHLRLGKELQVQPPTAVLSGRDSLTMGDLRPIIKQSHPIDLSTPYSPVSLSGEIVLVTGAANGLGAAIVRHLASHGSHLLLGDIDTAAGEALAVELREAYPKQTIFCGGLRCYGL